MPATWKSNLEVTIFGESHGKAIGVVLGNFPAGIKVDEEFIAVQMKKRAPGLNIMSTSRKEADKVEIVSGVFEGMTTGAPICGMIYNSDQHSKDYSILKEKMRPAHSDYPAAIRYNGFNDVRGGGHFSGRITAPIVFAGALCKLALKQKGIEIVSHIAQIKDVHDDLFPMDITPEMVERLSNMQYPVIKEGVFEQMSETIDEARWGQNSVGGKIECAILNVPVGLGDPFFDSVESKLSSLMFSIPAVKSIAFGNANISELTGKEANDEYYYDEFKNVKTTTNNNGGILGGITTGMPVVFTLGLKPTSSISLKQNTIDIKSRENTTLEIVGRHDPCVVLRAAVVVEAMSAIAALDLLND
ncbi:MAG: chorismate synthase [Erysipelotrichaceae bacterium]|nr:chorismate synthase [Erysipelotrichaceae bacterium]